MSVARTVSIRPVRDAVSLPLAARNVHAQVAVPGAYRTPTPTVSIIIIIICFGVKKGMGIVKLT